MRWDGQRIEAEAESRLPGLESGPVIRTFDAPEAMGIEFHEVEARSAINDVPPMAHVDFRHTINPYRGCTHGCAFCLRGDTQVLMATGATLPISEVRPGDEIYGTQIRGRYRRYVKTRIEAHWETRKPGYLIHLANGRTMVASGDHRFLTDRGWKFVTGSEQGRDRRPHLTLNNRMLGFGESHGAVAHREAYRRGYLCGMIRGDGTLGTYTYRRANGRPTTVHRFRLALADYEALARSKLFLEMAGVQTDEFDFGRPREGQRPIRAIRTSRRDAVDRCRSLIAWPARFDDDWTRGYLAGLYDAEGGYSNGILRIANTDEQIVARAEDALQAIGVGHRLEWSVNPQGNTSWNLRLIGGVPAFSRFVQMTDPAITRKREFFGTAVKSKQRLEVVAIEPVGDEDLYDITTGTGDFVANGVISHNCFARPTHKYLDLDPGEGFRTQIVVKVNLPEVLRAELRRPSWKGAHIALGTNTDPYQWVESKYRITRGVFEELLEARNPCSVLTRSPLLLRDLDLFEQLVERTDFAANLSIPTIDEKAWRATEPGSPHPMRRIEALAELSAAGIRTGVLIAPLMPGINDDPAQVEEILRLCGEAGAASIGGIALHLRGELRGLFFDWLREYRPDLLPRYERLYEGRGYMPKEERRRLNRMIRRGRMEAPREMTIRRGRAKPDDVDDGGEAAARSGSERLEHGFVQRLF